MKFNPSIPIYLQIMDLLKKDIISGVLSSGEKLQSVRDLSEKYEVNLNTVQRACSELEREKIIFARRGIGNFITEDPKRISSLRLELSGRLVNNFLDGMRDAGFNNNEIVEIIDEALKNNE